MDTCLTPLAGDEVRLSLPVAALFLPVVLAAAESMATLAGLGPRAVGRCRLVSEEVFAHIAEECAHSGQRRLVELTLTVTSDGLLICFKTPFISFDPQSLPQYSIEALLDGGQADGLGLHLVRAYASDITLTRRGAKRELCLAMARQEEDYGSRAWHRLVPTLSPGLNMTPIQHQGKRVHRLEQAGGGKTYLVRALAREVLAWIDGSRSFGDIMNRVLKVMPEKGRQEVEDLFEALIHRGLVSVKTLPLTQAEITVHTEIEPVTVRAMDAYGKLSPKE